MRDRYDKSRGEKRDHKESLRRRKLKSKEAVSKTKTSHAVE